MVGDERSARNTGTNGVIAVLRGMVSAWRTLTSETRSGSATTNGSQSSNADQRRVHGTLSPAHILDPQAPVQEVLVLRETPQGTTPSQLPPLPTRLLVRIAAIGLGIIVLTTGAALGFALTRPTIRGGQVDIVYEPSPNSTSSVQLDRELATQEVVVRSARVSGPVAREAGKTLDAFEQDLSVEVLAGTEIVRIIVADSSAARARRFAQALADSYIRLGGSEVQALEAQIRQLGAQERAARGSEDEEGANELARRIDRLRERLAELPDPRTLQGTPRLLAPAQVLASPLAPQPVRAAAMGALIGAILAAGLAFVLTRQRSV